MLSNFIWNNYESGGGYTCPSCGRWVPWNEGHTCPTQDPIVFTTTPDIFQPIDFELHNKLDEILRLLKKLTGE